MPFDIYSAKNFKWKDIHLIFATGKHNRGIYYSGRHPFSYDKVKVLTSRDESGGRKPNLFETNMWDNSEGWAAVVDKDNIGFTIFILDELDSLFRLKLEKVKPQDPRRSRAMLSRNVEWDVGPKEILNGHVQIYVGDYQEARKYIYSLR